MAKLLVNVSHGPEHPTRAALGFLVGRAAVEAGHVPCSLRAMPSSCCGKARGFDPEGVAEPAMPAKLVDLTLEADRVLTF